LKEEAELAAAQAAVQQVPIPEVQETALKRTRTPPVVQPFTPPKDKELAKAFQMLAEGNPIAMRDALQTFYDQMPELSMDRYWIRTLQVVGSWAAGRDADALIHLHEVRNALFEPLSDKQNHPGVMPQTLVRYMLNEVDDGAVSFEAAKWPPWYGDLSQFYFGLVSLREGNLVRAKQYFEAYLAKKGTDPEWPYGLQPMAQKCIEQIDAFRDQITRADEWVSAKQASRARNALEEFRLQSLPLLHAAVDDRINAVRLAEKKEQEEQQIAERRQHETRIQADLDRIDELRTQNLPLVAQRDYRRAAAAMTRLIPEMKTTEGQQALLLARELYERMDGVKRFLIARISAVPYRATSELGGDAVNADLNGIRVALGSHGMMVIPWDQVNLRTLVQLLNHYLQDPKLADKEKAEISVSGAVLCYEGGAIRWATTLADKAAGMDSSLKEKIRQLMPDVMTE